MTRHASLMLRLVMAALMIATAIPARATDMPHSVASVTKGPVTERPLPRFVSIKSDKVFARRGPSKTHRIDWIYRQDNLPVEVVAEYGHWRRIRDRDGEGGWVHYALLSNTRTVIVDRAMLDLHSRPSEDMPVVARLEAGVIARLDKCTPGWCRLIADGYKGWAPKVALWGVAPNEIRD